MKPPEAIYQLPASILDIQEIGEDGLWGFVRLGGTQPAKFVCSWGGGWDHVSLSYPHRCPSWSEMSAAKRLFFNPDECVMQMHPPEPEYVNCHPHCLHLWKPQGRAIPRPPGWMV